MVTLTCWGYCQILNIGVSLSLRNKTIDEIIVHKKYKSINRVYESKHLGVGINSKINTKHTNITRCKLSKSLNFFMKP